MRKLNYLMIGAAGLLLASCASEDLQGPATNDGNVSITVNLPGDAMSTRADYGSGTASKVLNYAVYTVGSDNATTLSFIGTADFGSSTSTTLSLNLLDKKYTIAFFAQSSESAKEGVYTLNTSGASPVLNVNYEAMTSATNVADGYDCFYNVETVDLSETNATSFNVTLYRPVAQVNWGANDINATTEIGNTFGTTGQYIQTSLQVKGLPTTLDLFSGETDDTKTYTGNVGGDNTLFAKPDGVYPVNSPTNQYVAIQYFLVGAPKEITGEDAAGGTYDFTLNIENSGNNNEKSYTTDVIVTNAPLKANYQTNIYGTLLSNSTSFDIEVSPGFAGSELIPLTWDGKTVTYPEEVDGQVSIKSPSDLAGLGEIINGTADGVAQSDFAGKTIVLEADFDMGGNELSLGSGARNSAELADGTNSFKGVFDGQGHTISNVKLTYEGTNGDDVVAFIPSLAGSDAEVKNVTFENLVIEGGIAEQAAVVGLVSGGATVSGVTVNSGSISATEGAAGIVGRVLGSGTVTNCVNKAQISCTSKSSGGIVGAAYYTESKGSVVVSYCDNYGNVTANAGAKESIGGIVGVSGADISYCNNYGNIVGDNVPTIGGIAGYQVSCGSITNCINYGNVTGSNFVGGILGWIGNGSYTYREPIYITGNTNNGAVEATTGQAAGILTINRATGYIENNTNNAPSIKALGAAAAFVSGGFVGGNNTSTGGDGYLHLSGNVNKTDASNITGTPSSTSFIGTVMIGNEVVTQ